MGKICGECRHYMAEDPEYFNEDAGEDYGTCHAPKPVCLEDHGYAESTTYNTKAKHCELFKRS